MEARCSATIATPFGLLLCPEDVERYDNLADYNGQIHCFPFCARHLEMLRANQRAEALAHKVIN